MNIWKQLKLEPTDDKRLIKRAYAKQLKQCKPDEKPEEFQALHEAYQRALSLAEYAQQEDQAKQQEAKQEEDRQEQVTNELKAEQEGSEKIELDFDLEAEPENQNDQEPAFNVELEDETEDEAVIVADIAHQQTQFNAYLDDFVNYIQTQGKYPKHKSWQVFLDSEFLDEPQLKQTTSYQIFDTVISLCTQERKEDENDFDSDTIYHLVPTIEENLLLALSNHFNWLKQRIELEEIFDLNAVDYVLDLVADAQQKTLVERRFIELEIRSPQEESQAEIIKFKRTVAFWLVDLPLVIFVSDVISQNTTKVEFVDAALIIFLTYFSLLESNLFKLNASLGKKLLGLKVVKVKSFLPVNIYQSFWRTVVSLPFVLFASITVWITLSTKRNFLNDLFSATAVVETKRFPLDKVSRFLFGH